MLELWKPVPLCGAYWVSSQGRVRKGKTLVTPNMRGRGEPKYLSVWLRLAPNQRIQKLVHILVLETFVGPRPPGQQARHLDGATTNCSLANLKWGTPQENVADKKRHGTLWRKLSPAQVLELRARTWKRGEMVALAKKLGVSHSTISMLLSGKTWNDMKAWGS